MVLTVGWVKLKASWARRVHLADPCAKEHMMSNNKNMNDVGQNDWLELQDQAKLHDRQMKELMASHVEDHQRSVQAKTDGGKWDPLDMGPNKQVSKMVPSYHGPAYSPKTEYGLGTKNQVRSMDMLKRNDIWIADFGASNHVTFSDKGCRNKRIATGSTHRIVGNSVLPKCELDIPCVHFDKDGAQVGEVLIVDVSHLPEGIQSFQCDKVAEKGVNPDRKCRLHQAPKRGEIIAVQHSNQYTQGSFVCGQILQKRG